jgi:NAD kinase
LSHRAIVLDANEELLLTVNEASGLTTLVIDGQGFYPMHQGDSVKLTRHATTYPLLALKGFDPYKRLRERLGWRGSVEPDVFPGDAPDPKCETDEGGL